VDGYIYRDKSLGSNLQTGAIRVGSVIYKRHSSESVSPRS